MRITSVVIFLSILCAFAAAAHAVTFNHVASLGDSLFDDSNGNRSPVAAEHVAQRLGAPLTKFASSGATSTALIDQGQHTRAAAQFEAGDLAMLWIGGNDVFSSPVGVAFGNYDNFLDTLDANVDQTLSTLRGAGLDVVMFNLPDFAEVPVIQNVVRALTPLNFLRDAYLDNYTQAARFANFRLHDLAVEHGAVLVDVFSMLEEVVDDPSDFNILGHTPVLAPDYDCQYCVFADSVHPSAYVQGIIANGAIDAINAAFDPQGAMPLGRLSTVELALLADLLAGDFDESGAVDGGDLAKWQTGFGASGNLEHADGEADGNGRVDGGDFLVWQQQHAMTPAAVQAVPEPAAIPLSILAVIASLQVRRKPRA